MERPKNTNRNKISTKDKEISLEVFCVAPSQEVSKDHDTSVYEIDIQSDFEITSCGVKGKSLDADSKESTVDGKKRSKGSREVRNPFIHSYYPNFLGTSSEFKEMELEKKESIPSEQRDVVKEEEEQHLMGKADKENESPSGHAAEKFDKYLKSYIIENFFSSKSKDLKGLFQSNDSKLDTNGLHLHHHEHHHHHHYYLDKSIVDESSVKSEMSNVTKVFFSKTSHRNRDADEETADELEKDAMDFPQCDIKSDATFTRLNVDADGRTAPTKHLKCSPSLRFKTSVSVESVLHKKSDFIKSHVYSDTDVTKRDSDETADLETFEGSAAEASQGKSNYSLIVNSLKSFNQFKLPVIITDQKTVPKVSYITCQCSSSDLLQKVSNIVLVNAAKTTLKKQSDLEKTSESDDSTPIAGINQRTGNASKKFRFEIWTAKLKAELKEIKKELRKIEERHSKKTKSPFAQLCNGKLSLNQNLNQNPNSKRARRISVYSSKTFVISPEDVCMNKKRECKRLEKDSRFLFDKKRLVLSGTQVDELFFWPGEGGGLEEEQILNEEYNEEYNEECISQYEQTYTNGLYNFSNKIIL